MKRTVNRKLLKNKIRELGESGMSRLTIESKVGYSTIEKLRAGTYPAQPSEKVRLGLCRALGVEEDELFPPKAS